jgi:hypothetical protein
LLTAEIKHFPAKDNIQKYVDKAIDIYFQFRSVSTLRDWVGKNVPDQLQAQVFNVAYEKLSKMRATIP